MAKKFPLHPKHPERLCWGCDRYCAKDALACGNGSGRTQHPAELLGDDWYLVGDWGFDVDDAATSIDPSLPPCSKTPRLTPPRTSQTMDFEPLRLLPGDDLRETLAAHSRAGGMNAFVVSGIGSLSRASLRLAGADTSLVVDGPLEILSLAGSLCSDGVHLHAAVADAHGRVMGGHVMAGCIVRTTAEILLAVLPKGQLSRVFDPTTGYPELLVSPAANR